MGKWIMKKNESIKEINDDWLKLLIYNRLESMTSNVIYINVSWISLNFYVMLDCRKKVCFCRWPKLKIFYIFEISVVKQI